MTTPVDHETITRRHSPLLKGGISFLIVWFVASALLYLTLQPTIRLALQWDEVNYILAARQGLITNATDSTSMTATEFIRFVQAKYQNRPSQPSAAYDESQDVFMLRHTHPPLLQYALSILGTERLAPGYEFQQRLIHFMGGVILIGTMLWGYVRMSSRPTVAGMITLAAAALLSAFFLCRDLNCHLWIAISLVPASLAVGRFMKLQSAASGLLAGACLGLNFLGLQTGLFTSFFAVIAIGIWTIPPALKADGFKLNVILQQLKLWIKHSAWMIAGFFAFLLVTYPGSIIRLSMLRIIAVYAYLIVKSSEYSGVSDRYSGLLALTFPLVVLGIIGLGLFVSRRDPELKHFRIATIIIAIGYGLVMAKFLLNVTYIIPALALMSVAGVVFISSMRSAILEIVTAAGMIGSTAYIILSFPVDTHRYTVDQMQHMAGVIGTRQAWVEGGHCMRYYNPEIAEQIHDVTLADANTALTYRDTSTLTYKKISDQELAGSLVILGAFNGLPPYKWEMQLPPNTTQIKDSIIQGRIYQIPLVKEPESSPDSQVDPKSTPDPLQKAQKP